MTTLRFIIFTKTLPLQVAEAKGFLAAEGLEAHWEITRGSIEQIRGLRDARWDIAQTAADNVMAYVNREGADLMVFLVTDLGIEQALFVQPDIQTYAQLKGKALGVDAYDTGYAFILRKMLALNGLAAEDYELIPIGGPQLRREALRSGQIAGGLLGSSDEALEAGFKILDYANKHFPLYAGGTMATTRSWASGHQKELLGCTRALLKGARWAMDPAHAEEAVKLIAKERQIDLAAARRSHQAWLTSRGAVPSLDQVKQALEVERQLRLEMTGVGQSLEAYFDGKYMEQALEAVT